LVKNADNHRSNEAGEIAAVAEWTGVTWIMQDAKLEEQM
jgi:hypothetical protein